MTIAEDMSYNHGPMVSRRSSIEFLTPYYRRLLERVKDMNLITIVDTDGDVTRCALAAIGRGRRRAAARTSGRRGWHGAA